MPIPKRQLEQFVGTLGKPLQEIYRIADQEMLTTADTLTTDFQLVAAIRRCFDDFLEERPELIENIDILEHKSK